MVQLIPVAPNRFYLPIDYILTIEGGLLCRDAVRDTSSGALNNFCSEIPSGYPKMKALLTSLQKAKCHGLMDPPPYMYFSQTARVS